MLFWSFIDDHYAVITFIALAWILGILAGRKINGIKKIFIKNPFAGVKSSIKDFSPPVNDNLRFKREYVINLIVNKNQELPYDDISAFTVRLDDIIDNNRLKSYAVLNSKSENNHYQSDAGIDNIIENKIDLSEDDANEVVLPNSYGNEQKDISSNNIV